MEADETMENLESQETQQPQAITTEDVNGQQSTIHHSSENPLPPPPPMHPRQLQAFSLYPSVPPPPMPQPAPWNVLLGPGARAGRSRFGAFPGFMGRRGPHAGFFPHHHGPPHHSHWHGRHFPGAGRFDPRFAYEGHHQENWRGRYWGSEGEGPEDAPTCRGFRASMVRFKWRLYFIILERVYVKFKVTNARFYSRIFGYGKPKWEGAENGH